MANVANMTSAGGFNSESRFVEQAFADGVALLVEAKNYISFSEKREREGAGLSNGLRIGYQQTRLTARIMHGLAWLLGHKAIAAGEILAEQLESANWELGGRADCTLRDGEESETLPKGLRELLGKSHAFYLRVARLETMMKTTSTPRVMRYDAPQGFTGLRLIVSDAGPVALRA